LDPILKFYIEDHESPQKIIARGFDKKVVEDVIKLVDRNEYKRRQAAPGLKVTSKAFGVGRREPIVRKF
jgi:NH3-dependent NAD+ synthetase